MTDLTHTAELARLEQQRQLLERLLAATRSLESLKGTLEQLLLQQEGPEQVPERLESLFEALGHRIRNLSDAEVLLRLEKLDRSLRVRLKRFTVLLDVADDGTEPLDTEAWADAEAQLGDFHRLARTGVALRILLGRRRVKVPDLHLPVDREALAGQLKGLASREKRTRRQVVQDIEQMAGDIDQLLARPSVPDKVRELLAQMKQGLAENREHLLAGHPVGELPLPMENLSFTETPPGSEPAPPESDDSAALPQPQVEESAPETDTAPQADKPREAPPEKGSRPGLLRSLWRWANAPWGVTWREVREGKPRDSEKFRRRSGKPPRG